MTWGYFVGHFLPMAIITTVVLGCILTLFTTAVMGAFLNKVGHMLSADEVQARTDNVRHIHQ